MAIRRTYFLVNGRVQGVAYRASAERAASAESLSGWVRNRPDGAVEGEAQGDAAAVDRFLMWCQRGPAAARVDDLVVTERAPIADERGFHVRYR
jgi:acylphosphatase